MIISPNIQEILMPIRKAFSEKLRGLLETNKINQRQFAEKLQFAPSMVTDWLKGRHIPSCVNLVKICRFFQVSSDYLLDLELIGGGGYMTVSESDGFKWIEHVPDNLPEDQIYEYKTGIRIFRALVKEGLLENQLTAKNGPFEGLAWQSLHRAFRATVSSGALQIINIPRSKIKEDIIKEHYPVLRRVIVARLPHKTSLWSPLLRTEFVAFLTATEAFTDTGLRGNTVGIGPGYTLYRCAELLIPSHTRFAGTNWAAMMEVRDRTTEHIAVSSDLTVKVLAARNPGSQAYLLPYLQEDQRNFEFDTRTPQQEVALQTLGKLSEAIALFISVGGVTTNQPPYEEQLGATAQMFSAKALDSLRQKLPGFGLEQEFCGEVIGHFLNQDAHPLASPKFQRERDYHIYSPDIGLLRQIVGRMNLVWVIAGAAYKKKPVEMMIRNKLANALVIDEDIADYLIERASNRR
jgi:transcriptional regulator with XRE-family HTH domain